MTSDSSAPTTETPKSFRRGRSVPEMAALIVVLIEVSFFFAVQSEYFLTGQNITNVLVGASVFGIVAAPATLLLVSEQFDLFVGSGAALIGVVMAWGRPSTVALRRYCYVLARES